MHSYLLYLPISVRSLDDVPAADGLLQPGDDGIEWLPTTMTGPDGQPGRLGHWRHRDKPQCIPHMVYEPTSQEWRRVAGSDLWIGFKRAQPVHPDALQRTKTHAGYRLSLADGHHWELPCGMMLPQSYAFAGETLTRTVKPAYQSLYERTQWAFEFCCAQVTNSISLTADTELEVIKYVGEMLSHNYRVNWQIAVTLGVLQPEADDGASLMQMLMATTDVPRVQQLIEELKTKKAPTTGSGLGTASGSTD